jgi:hypothetical protein
LGGCQGRRGGGLSKRAVATDAPSPGARAHSISHDHRAIGPPQHHTLTTYTKRHPEVFPGAADVFSQVSALPAPSLHLTAPFHWSLPGILDALSAQTRRLRSKSAAPSSEPFRHGKHDHQPPPPTPTPPLRTCVAFPAAPCAAKHEGKLAPAAHIPLTLPPSHNSSRQRRCWGLQAQGGSASDLWRIMMQAPGLVPLCVGRMRLRRSEPLRSIEWQPRRRLREWESAALALPRGAGVPSWFSARPRVPDPLRCRNPADHPSLRPSVASEGLSPARSAPLGRFCSRDLLRHHHAFPPSSPHSPSSPSASPCRANVHQRLHRNPAARPRNSHFPRLCTAFPPALLEAPDMSMYERKNLWTTVLGDNSSLPAFSPRPSTLAKHAPPRPLPPPLPLCTSAEPARPNLRHRRHRASTADVAVGPAFVVAPSRPSFPSPASPLRHSSHRASLAAENRSRVSAPRKPPPGSEPPPRSSCAG